MAFTPKPANQPNYLDRTRFTLQQYQQALTQPYQYANPDDHTDQAYYKKYAHNLPPFDAYFIRLSNAHLVNTDEDSNARKVYWGWNNISEFEKRMLNELKAHMTTHNIIIPVNFKERELLKFLQGEKFNIVVVAEKLRQHFIWLEELPIERQLTPLNLKVITSGCLYIHGRDKFLRPTCILDCVVLSNLCEQYPGEGSGEAFMEAFLFVYEYAKKVMLMPGTIEQWVMIVNLGNLGMNSLPRANIMTFGKVTQAHLCYAMQKSYYVEASWSQRMCFSAAKTFLAAETCAKMGFYGEQNPQELIDMYHPCQLEKRFGGEADTPTNFWPPFVGPEFYPNGDKSHLNLITKEEYPSVIRENPELEVHPEFFKSEGQKSRDFIHSELQIDLDFIEEDEIKLPVPNESKQIEQFSEYSRSTGREDDKDDQAKTPQLSKSEVTKKTQSDQSKTDTSWFKFILYAVFVLLILRCSGEKQIHCSPIRYIQTHQLQNQVTDQFQFTTILEAKDQDSQKFQEINTGCFIVDQFNNSVAMLRSCSNKENRNQTHEEQTTSFILGEDLLKDIQEFRFRISYSETWLDEFAPESPVKRVPREKILRFKGRSNSLRINLMQLDLMNKAVFQSERQQFLNIDEASIEQNEENVDSISIEIQHSQKHQVCKLVHAGAFNILVQVLGAALSWAMLQNSPYALDLLQKQVEPKTQEFPRDEIQSAKHFNKMALLEAVAKKVLSKSERDQLKAHVKVSTLTTGNDSDTDEQPTTRRSKNDNTLNFDEQKTPIKKYKDNAIQMENSKAQNKLSPIRNPNAQSSHSPFAMDQTYQQYFQQDSQKSLIGTINSTPAKRNSQLQNSNMKGRVAPFKEQDRSRRNDEKI